MLPSGALQYPHRIRLRGPWQCEPLARIVRRAGGRAETVPVPLPPACRMIMPCRWGESGLAGFAGRVRFRRRFGYPGRIDSYERVWLTFAGADAVAEVCLNGRCLGRHEGATDPFEFEVTELLGPRNELVVEVEAPEGNGGLWGEVALEVRRTAFLRAVRTWATVTGETTHVHAAGEVVGTGEGPLELYVILDRSTVAYAPVEATPGGRVFQMVSEDISLGRQAAGEPLSAAHRVRVELVGGAVVWYAVEHTLEFWPG